MNQQLIGQILSIFTPVLTAFSYQANTQKKLLVVQSAATFCTCVSYLLLGASSGFTLNIVCLIRNLCFYFLKEGTIANRTATCLLAIAMGALGALSWQGPVSLFIIIALVINTVFMSFGRPQLLRCSILLTSSMILIYNVLVFSIGGIINESLAIISSVVGILRFRRATPLH